MFEHCKTWSFLSDPTVDLNLMPILFNHQKLIGSILIIRLTATCLGIIKLSNNINNTLDIFLFSPISVSTSHARITYGSQCEPCSWICAIWTPYYGALGWVVSKLHMAYSVKLAVNLCHLKFRDGLYLKEKVLNLQLTSTILLSSPPVLQTSLKRWTVFVTHNKANKVQTEQDIFEKCDSCKVEPCHASWALVILVILVTNIRYGNLPRQLRSNIRL